MSGCVGINSVSVSASCNGTLINTEISYDSGVTYESILNKTGPWFFADSIQPDNELKIRATITRPNCNTQYVTSSYYPDEECVYTKNYLGITLDAGSDKEVVLPITPFEDENGIQSYTVDWGDGNVETLTNQDAYHTYVSTGSYNTKVTGKFDKLDYPKEEITQAFRNKVKKIYNWGPNMPLTYHLSKCPNLTVTATDLLNTSRLTTISRIFSECTSVNSVPRIGEWDMSRFTSLSGMFFRSGFDGDLSNWDVSSVKNMLFLFRESNFNNGGNDLIKNWNTTSLQRVEQMFYNAKKFNQPLTNWDTSNVLNFSEWFYGASSFNQDLSNLSLENVFSAYSSTLLSNSFENAFSYSGLDPNNYDKLLIRLASEAQTHNKRYIILGAHELKHTSAGLSARNTLVNTLGWSITDAGQI
jgi:surface protein